MELKEKKIAPIKIRLLGLWYAIKYLFNMGGMFIKTQTKVEISNSSELIVSYWGFNIVNNKWVNHHVIYDGHNKPLGYIDGTLIS